MSNDSDSINKILSLAPPNIQKFGDLEYSDKELKLIYPPSPKPVCCSTLQGLADLWSGELDDAKKSGDLLVHITSPTSVELIGRESDDHGRRRVWAEAKYPECKSFGFGAWMDPETFIIAAQAGFQRVKVQNDDGSFVKDLDYVLDIASHITAENAVSNQDDGFAQRVAVKQGIALKAERILRPMVNLAPYRTFAEIDQVLSTFVFRARVNGGSAMLALFEGDGGRWKLGAYLAIAAWLSGKFGDTPIIS
jgi:hypothetical protein